MLIFAGDLARGRARQAVFISKSAPRRQRRDRPMATEEVNKIVEQMGSRIGANSGLGGTVKIDFGDPGSVYIDGKSNPNTVSEGSGKNADCTISVSLETFDKMVT